MTTRPIPPPDPEVEKILRRTVGGRRSEDTELPRRTMVSGGVVTVARRAADVADVAAGECEQFKSS